MRDSDIYREVIHPWEDAHPDAGPDEDSLRAYFAGRLHADWPDRAHRRVIDQPVRHCLAVIAGSFAAAVLILTIVWTVTG